MRRPVCSLLLGSAKKTASTSVQSVWRQQLRHDESAVKWWGAGDDEARVPYLSRALRRYRFNSTTLPGILFLDYCFTAI